MAKTKKTVGFDLHKAALAQAEDCVKLHIEKDENGEPCFNLCAFLQTVESRLGVTVNGHGTPTGRFDLNTFQTARYLWCCLALDGGDKPDGTTFRGMPIVV